MTAENETDHHRPSRPSEQLQLDLERATSLRRQQGQDHLAEILNWWFTRNGLSHAQASAIAAWTTGERTALQTSQLSHLRNGRLSSPQLKVFEGLAALNDGIDSWQRRGPSWCIERWGPVPDRLFGGAALAAGAVLWHPQQQGEQPLVFADFCAAFAGFLRLDYIGEAPCSPSQCREISDAIGADLGAWLSQAGGIRTGMARLKELYPEQGKAQWQKLQRVILGESTYSAAELDQIQRTLVNLFTAAGIEPSTPRLKSFIEQR